MIHRRLYPDQDLVVHEVEGVLTEEALYEAGLTLYDLDPPPSKSLWDLTGMAPPILPMEAISRIQDQLVPQVHGREQGRTAVVAPSDLAFGMVRQYDILSEDHELPLEQRIFRSRAEACAWLEVEIPSPDDTQ